MRAQLMVASLAALLLTGSCDDRGDTAADPELAASAQSSVVAAKPQGVVLPPVRPYDDNPLNLPGASVDVAKGARVFAVPKRISAPPPTTGLLFSCPAFFMAAE